MQASCFETKISRRDDNSEQTFLFFLLFSLELVMIWSENKKSISDDWTISRSSKRGESYDCDCLCGCCIGRRLCNSLPGTVSAIILCDVDWHWMCCWFWLWHNYEQVYKKTCSSRHMRKEEKSSSCQEKCWWKPSRRWETNCIWILVPPHMPQLISTGVKLNQVWSSELLSWHWLNLETSAMLSVILNNPFWSSSSSTIFIYFYLFTNKASLTVLICSDDLFQQFFFGRTRSVCFHSSPRSRWQ